MDTDINTIDSSYESETISYNDAQLESIISAINEIETLLSSVDTEISGLTSHDSEWKGKSKDEYLDLKNFLVKYRDDYGKSIEKLESAVSGLKTLLGSIPESKVMKEIEDA